MKTIVATSQQDLGRELDRDLLLRGDLRIVTAHTIPELLERLHRGAQLCLLGPMLADGSAAAALHAIRADKRAALCPVVLLLPPGASRIQRTAGKADFGSAQRSGAPSFDSAQRSGAPSFDSAQRSGAPSFDSAQRSGAPSFDEVMWLPAPPGALPLLLGRLLGLPVRGGERFPMRLHVFSEAPASSGSVSRREDAEDGPPPDEYLGTTADLSEAGLLLRTRRPLPIGDRLALRFALPGRPGDLDLRARVVRIDEKTFAPDVGLGLSFERLSEVDKKGLRDYLMTLMGGRPFRWHIVKEGERQVISLTGVLQADSDLTPLRQLRGELDFHLRDFRRISSDSIQNWLDLIRSLTGASRIRLFECPIAFVQQANAISNLLDQTEVQSFFAPYMCPRCGLDEERLIVAADLTRDLSPAAPEIRPPAFPCSSCGAALSFDNLPERYFAFLSDRKAPR